MASTSSITRTSSPIRQAILLQVLSPCPVKEVISGRQQQGRREVVGEAGAGLCQPQPPSQESRAERSQSRSAETLHNVERCCRHWQILFPHRIVCRRDGGNADRAEAHPTHKESTREHDEYKSVTGKPDKWQS